MQEKELSDEEKEIYEEAKEHKACFGKYVDENDYFCEDGTSGLCNYCVECRRACVYI